MSYIYDRPIQKYIDEERARCRALIELDHIEKRYLLWCIDNVIHADQVGEFHTRYQEFGNPPGLISPTGRSNNTPFRYDGPLDLEDLF